MKQKPRNANKATSSRRRQQARSRLQYDACEPRQLLAGISLDAGEVFIGGFESADSVEVIQGNSVVTIRFENLPTQRFPAADVNQITFVGAGGDDFFYNNTAIPSRAYGGDGNDYLQGGSSNDILVGGRGDDTVSGQDGDDIARGGGGLGFDSVSGGNGNDRLFGGFEKSQIYGGAGDDKIYGGAGDDFISAGAGDDSIFPGHGENEVKGGDGDDLVISGNGNDLVYGDAGSDRVYSGGGDDLIYGGAGFDFLIAGDGDDDIYGQSGADFVRGGLGDDFIVTGGGVTGARDRVFGDAGNDTIRGSGDSEYINGGAGRDTIEAYGGDDVIFSGDGNDNIRAGDGNDWVDGGLGDDRIEGYNGDDFLFGGDGNDLIYGESGDDFVQAGQGEDEVFGGIGDDVLDGGFGDDTLKGEEGADFIIGNLGNDTIEGGIGNDRIEGGSGNDTVDAGTGNDRIDGGFGNDAIDGGEGADVVIYSRVKSDYSVTGIGALVVTANAGSEGVDDVTTAERFLFSDVNVAAVADPFGPERITIRPIIVANSNGTNRSTFFGTSQQEENVKSIIDEIYDQAGIDVLWQAPAFYNNTFANVGNGGSRPESDLDTIVSAGDADGVGSPNNLVIDMYFVDIAPGYGQTGENIVSGNGLFDEGGIGVAVGTELLSVAEGRALIARGLSQAIGRNLGLEFVAHPSNLMSASIDGRTLTAEQVATTIGSDLSQPIQ